MPLGRTGGFLARGSGMAAMSRVIVRCEVAPTAFPAALGVAFGCSGLTMQAPDAVILTSMRQLPIIWAGLVRRFRVPAFLPSAFPFNGSLNEKNEEERLGFRAARTERGLFSCVNGECKLQHRRNR